MFNCIINNSIEYVGVNFLYGACVISQAWNISVTHFIPSSQFYESIWQSNYLPVNNIYANVYVQLYITYKAKENW